MRFLDRLGRIGGWPVMKQAARRDATAFGETSFTKRTIELRPRTMDADRTVRSICPYCAVGCGQLVYVQDGRISDIEGDPDSPISRGRLCPKGAASRQLVNAPTREYKVKYRRPHGTEWEELSLDDAMDMIADRVIDTRDQTWEDKGPDGITKRHRTLGFASLGGATLDNEENYLIKKFFTALGAVQIENQARI
jgi:formate dehydrogenase major subunit